MERRVILQKTEGIRRVKYVIHDAMFRIRRGELIMEFFDEDQRKQAFELFIRALAAAPDSLVESLTGKEYATHAIDGAKAIEEYLFPKAKEKK
jgi:hypothetical protein